MEGINVKQIPRFLPRALHTGILVTAVSLPATGSAEMIGPPADDIPGQSIRSTREPVADRVPAPIPQDTWAVRLRTGIDADAVAASLGASNRGQIGNLERTFLFHIPQSAVRAENIRQSLERLPAIEWVEQQHARPRVTRPLPDDPLFSDQWHLLNQGTGCSSCVDVNITPAWDSGFQGQGVVIGIIDSGLEYTHPDLAPNFRADLSYDYFDDDADAAPGPDPGSERHATAVAGVAAARDDGAACGVGSAYRAEIAGLRLIVGPVTDAQEAGALSHETAAIQLYSSSWGPSDNGAVLESPGTLTLAAMAQAVQDGRGGLGNLYVWAGGNGNDNFDDVNADGYASSRYTIAIAATDDDGVQSWYSEPGASLLVTAPSSSDTSSITTTDRTAPNGYDGSADCTDTFGGTSSSAPLVAGIIALMLQANPQLTWRDVQHILVQTASKNHSGDSGWFTNGGGLEFNHKYGFGLVDAALAVSTAQSWPGVADAATPISSLPQTVGEPIPDGVSAQQAGAPVTHSITVDDDLLVEHVEVVFSATHPWRGDLEVVLESPSGTRSRLIRPRFNDNNDDFAGWMFTSVAHWGESSAGEWTLSVTDNFNDFTGTFDEWQLTLHGTPPTSSGTVIFQDDFE